MFETLARKNRISPVLKVFLLMLLFTGLDFLAAPSLGYVRDHVVNGLLDDAHLPSHVFDWHEGILLPMLLVFHLVAAFVVDQVEIIRSPEGSRVRKNVLVAATLSLPAVYIAFVFDELLYMQLRW